MINGNSLYSRLKEKQQKYIKDMNFYDVLLQTILPMIEYKDFPKTVNTKFLEKYRITEGAVALFRYEKTTDNVMTNELVCGGVTFGGLPYPNGLGRIAIVSTDNGYVKQFDNWIDNPDIAIIFLNSNYSPDLNVGIFADLLSELITSIKCNILNSSYTNIPVVEDSKQKTAVDKALTDIRNGKATSVLLNTGVSKELCELLGNDGKKDFPTLNLTNVKDSDKIQYLCKAYDDVFRWFYSLYGMNTAGSSKMAQQTRDEIMTDNISSLIIPEDMLKCACEGVEMFNKKFGMSASAAFSMLWKRREEEKQTNEETAEETQTNEETTESEVEENETERSE